MATTLCDGMDTLGMVVTPIKDSHEVLSNQPLVGQIPIGDILVDHLLVDLPIGPPVDGLFINRIHVGRSPINQPHVGQPLVMVVPPWHATIAKLQELPTHPHIDLTKVLFDVMMVQN
jgi:hypothetical protein